MDWRKASASEAGVVGAAGGAVEEDMLVKCYFGKRLGARRMIPTVGI